MQHHVAVLGATGYLGRSVVAALLADGQRVGMIARRAPAAIPTGAAFHALDACDAASLASALRGADRVVNAMAGPPASMVRVAMHLQSAMADDTARHLVHVSSLAVFAQRAGVLDEATEMRPARWHAYATAKSRAEHILRADPAVAARCAILRPGCIHGAGAPVWTDRIGRLLLAGRLGWLGRAGGGWCRAVHVDDVALAVLRAVHGTDAAAAGVHHVLAPEELTWNGFFRRFAAQLGVAAASIGPARLAGETWIVAPWARLCAPPGSDIITPDMRRVFRNRALPVCTRSPLVAPGECRKLDAALADAAAALLSRRGAAPARFAALRPAWAASP